MPRQTPYLAAGLTLCGLLCSAPPAVAQLAPSGGSFGVNTTAVRGNASAYDPKNNLFLAIGAAGSVLGRLVKPDGSFAAAPFQIDMATGYCQYPSVSYSPDADSGRGAYLVTWHQNIGPRDNFVHARLVSAVGTPLGAPVVLGSEPTWWEIAPNVDYATVSHVFMVTWRIGVYQIRAARVSLTGQNLDPGQGLLISTGGFERDPSVAYSPDNDAFLVSYADFAGNVGHASARLAAASNGSLGAPQLLGIGISCYMTDATFSTSAHKFLVGWYQLGSGATGRLVNLAGIPLGNPIPMSGRFGTYDSLGVAYNPQTQTSLVVGQDLISAENGGAEISDAGTPGAGVVLTNAGGQQGNFYPQVSSSTTEGKWMLTTAHDFNTLVGQFARAGGPVAQAPVVTTHPHSTAVHSGHSVSFTAAATGTPAPGMQWQSSTTNGSGNDQWSNISGATSTTLTFTARPSDNHKWYRAFFYNGVGAGALSQVAQLTVTGGSPSDFDGDGKADPLIWNAATGTWHWLGSSSSNGLGVSGIQWGNQSLGDIILNGDIDGDGIGDLIVWRATTGTWHWLTSSTGYSYAAQGQKQWGNQSLGDVPMVGDVDGDGRADLMVWRASTGTWFWLTSGSGYDYATAGLKQWGNQSLGDVPLLGDFDGDGRDDLAVWRGSSGTWFWLTSSSGYSYNTAGIAQWGNQSLGDVPLVGDLDGDGATDLVIWRKSTGTWYWLSSSTGFSQAAAHGLQWGNQNYGDVPMLSDFDGDGQADIVIFRPTDGTWYWLTSATGYQAQATMQFGSAGDIPIVR
jgi:hypothetical protein